MTVTLAPTPRYQWQGLSGDTKPTTNTVGINDIFFETDTGKFFIYNGTAWNSYTIGGAGTPGGSSNQLQINSAGAFAGVANATSGYVLTAQGTSSAPVFAAPTSPPFSINSQTGTTYTLVIGDQSNEVRMSNAAANNLTVPPNSSVAFPIGSQIVVHQGSTGRTKLVPGSGVTFVYPANALYSTGLFLAGQGNKIFLFKTATDTWEVYGALQFSTFDVGDLSSSHPRIDGVNNLFDFVGPTGTAFPFLGAGTDGSGNPYPDFSVSLDPTTKMVLAAKTDFLARYESQVLINASPYTVNLGTDLTSTYLIDATSANLTINLPSATDSIDGGGTGFPTIAFKRIDTSGHTVTLQRAGSDTLQGGGTTLSMASNDFHELRSDGVSKWYLTP